MITRSHALALLLLLAAAAPLAAVEVSFRPAAPTFADAIDVELRGCAQGGVLHWGVNARGNQWQKAPAEYRPAGSVEDGLATRTPLEGPDTDGVCRVTLGPFDRTNQPVSSVDFAVQWSDGTWDTAGGKDYHIPISAARIGVAPERPTINDGLTVTVHRSRVAGQLRWGVNAARGVWQPPHAIYRPPGTAMADDGVAVDSPLPPPDASGDSVITLGPFTRPEQVVTSLHMAVHWGTEWDTDSGRNYNVPVAPDAGWPRVVFYTPFAGEELRTTAVIRVGAIGADVVSLRLDDQPALSRRERPFRWVLPLGELPPGRHTLTARAESGGRVGLRQISFWRVPPFREEPLPEGAKLGATENTDGSVTFALFAPGKHFVLLIGDFNNWNPESDLMNRAPDGTWWIRRKLDAGRHTYQYLIEGEKRLADPYSRDVDWTNEAGEETYRPELARSVITVGSPPFAWSDPSFRRPPLENLLIYELAIDDFCPGEGFTGVIARLDYIRDLGVNAIEPLPFTEFPGAWSWGYNPAFHFAPESTYGTPEELKRLVNEAHRRGLAVIFDTVLNHMDVNSALFQLYGEDYDASPYFHLFLGDNWGFPDLDQPSEPFKRYAADVLRFWIEEYHIDGFRYDATRWVGWQGYNDWGAGWFAYAAKQAGSNTYQIAEHLPADPELQVRTEMDAGWHDYYRWRVREMIRNAELDRDELQKLMEPRRIGFGSAFERLVYIESHDEERFLRDLEQAGYSEDEAIRRDVLALTLTLTAPGPAMVYAGEEFGETSQKVLARNPLRWDRINRPAYRRLLESFRALARLRTTHPALRTESIAWPANSLPDGVAVYERTASNAAVVVAANFGRTEQPAVVTLGPGTWADVLASAQVAGGTNLMIQLPPGDVRVFSSE